MKTDCLYLSKPLYKNWALQFEGSKQSTNDIRKIFNSALYDEFEAIHGFFQCNGDTYLMVEFWSYDQDLILNICMEFAAKYGYELELK